MTHKPPSQSGNDNYDQYEKLYLICQDKLKTVASYNVEEDGRYNIVFSAQTVNNTGAWKKPINVMIAAKLFINGVKTGKGWTENVNPSRHYGNPFLIRYGLPLKQGDTIEIKMRADSTKTAPPKSIFVLMDPDRFQFDVGKS